MDSPYPERIVLRRTTTLDEFHGEWTDILSQMLMDFGCKTRIPVKIYSYHDGRVLAKYHIILMLPTKLRLSAVTPVGEALSMTAALEIAVLEAITRIREHKAQEMIGTSFTAIPHDSEDTKLQLDHLSFYSQLKQLVTWIDVEHS